MIAETLYNLDYYNQWLEQPDYDLKAYLGKDHVNGVMTYRDMYSGEGRNMVDDCATKALIMMTSVLSITLVMTTWQEKLRDSIDTVIAQQPSDFDALLGQLESMSYEIRKGNIHLLKHLVKSDLQIWMLLVSVILKRNLKQSFLVRLFIFQKQCKKTTETRQS